MARITYPVGREMTCQVQLDDGKVYNVNLTSYELNYNLGSFDATTFGDQAKTYVRGLKDCTIHMEGYLDMNAAASWETRNTTNIIIDPPMSERAKKLYRDGGAPHRLKPKEFSKVPWESKRVVIIGFDHDAEPGTTYAKSIEEKRKLTFENFDSILVAWPGQYSMDIFYVKHRDVKALRKALGLKPKSETVLVDEDGEEWSV